MERGLILKCVAAFALAAAVCAADGQVTLLIDDFDRDDMWVGTNWVDGRGGDGTIQAISGGSQNGRLDMYQVRYGMSYDDTNWVGTVLLSTLGYADVNVSFSGTFDRCYESGPHTLFFDFQAAGSAWSNVWSDSVSPGGTPKAFSVTNLALGPVARGKYLRVRFRPSGGWDDGCEVHEAAVQATETSGRKAHLVFRDHAASGTCASNGWVKGGSDKYTFSRSGSEYVKGHVGNDYALKYSWLERTIDTTGYDDLVMFIVGAYGGSNNDALWFDYSTDGGSNWTLIAGNDVVGEHGGDRFETFIELPEEAVNSPDALRVRMNANCTRAEKVRLDLVEVYGTIWRPPGTVVYIR